jgi:inhibitor of KinA
MVYREIVCSDSAIIFKAGDDISLETNSAVRRLLRFFEDTRIKGIVDFIPSYNELLISFDPSVTDHESLIKHLGSFKDEIDAIKLTESFIVCVPVLYGGTGGPDIADVAGHNSISEADVIRIHSERDYYVYMLGFTPGFCYLGGVDDRIVTPRRMTPRIGIPAGSVGIAGSQTGIYPLASPGGWQIIGKTPLRLFDPSRHPEFLINAGDYIRFCPVDSTGYRDIESAVEAGTWEVKKIRRAS